MVLASVRGDVMADPGKPTALSAPDLGTATLLAAATCGAMTASQVAGRAVRDALFLSSFPATMFPLAMGGAALLSVGAVLAFSPLLARHSPRRLAPIAFMLSAAGLVLEWLLGHFSAQASAVLVYFHTVVAAPTLISIFWSLIDEWFDPHSAKPAVTRIATGGTLGAVVGALLTWRAASLASLSTSVLLLALIHVACGVGTLFLGRRTGDRESRAPCVTPDVPLSAFGVFERAPFLRNLALLVLLGAVTSSLLDFVFSVQASAAVGTGPPLLAFFSLFWLAVSMLSAAVQFSLGRVAIERLALAVHIAVLPGIIILGGGIGLAVPGLTSSMLLRGSEAVQRNTLFRSAYELLYTPVAEGRRRSTKAVIDVGFDRAGTLLGSGIVLLALPLFIHSQSVLLGVVVALALATLPLARSIHVGYIAALARGLQDGADKLHLPPLPQSGLSPGGASEASSRAQLIERIELLRDPAHSGTGTLRDALHHPEALLSVAGRLLSNDPAEARRAMASPPASEVPVAGFLLLLLAHEELRVEARNALRQLAPRITGQLVDALLDPETDLSIRVRVPRVLERCTSQRAADGLLLGIAADRFEVRYASARSLIKLCDVTPEIVIPRERLVSAILGEVGPELEPPTEYDDDDSEDGKPLQVGDVLARDRSARRLEHVFTILLLQAPRDPLRLAFRALHNADTRHRGTALEYLQATLPADVRAAVWSLIGGDRPLPAARPAADVLAELTRATEVAAE